MNRPRYNVLVRWCPRRNHACQFWWRSVKVKGFGVAMGLILGFYVCWPWADPGICEGGESLRFLSSPFFSTFPSPFSPLPP